MCQGCVALLGASLAQPTIFSQGVHMMCAARPDKRGVIVLVDMMPSVLITQVLSKVTI